MLKTIKYLNPLIVYTFAIFAFIYVGVFSWLPVLYAFIFVPFVELFIKPNNENMSAAEEEIAKQNKWYDYLLYIVVFLQMPSVLFFLYSFTNQSLSGIDIAGRICSMGVLCGTFGINVGHELGHRKNKWEQTLAKISLLSSLYMHFFIEHNKGHHKHVATPNDPSSARYGEMIYLFYFRTIINTNISAWHIANEEVTKKGKKAFSIHNEMVQFNLIQIGFVLSILLVFGWLITLYYLGAAFFGILMLETVNYIEHYGLQRKVTTNGNYERTMPHHSWNSNHIFGRLLLFELSRHSDHHYLASRKYQILRSHNDAPQLPTGYPGSMLLSLVPPLWFYVMNKRIASLNK
jgi:alkane 1-monooxygenase